LAKASLPAVASIPSDQATEGVVQILEGGDHSRWLAAALRAYRWVWPAHVYEVQCSAQIEAQGNVCGVTVELVAPAIGRSWPPTTAWAATWDEAVKCAADELTGQLAALQRRSSRGQIPAGRTDRPMPGDMARLYRRIPDLQRARRHDEALDELHQLANHDPQSLRLRLLIAQTQEQLGLRMDALQSYAGALSIQRTRQGLFARFRRSELLEIASYRLMLQLGFADDLARQWCEYVTDPLPNRRDPELHRLRERLKPFLMKRYGADCDAEGMQKTFDCVDKAFEGVRWRDKHADTTAMERAYDKLRDLFLKCAKIELRKLKEDLAYRRLKGVHRQEITPKGLDITTITLEQREQWLKPPHWYAGNGQAQAASRSDVSRLCGTKSRINSRPVKRAIARTNIHWPLVDKGGNPLERVHGKLEIRSAWAITCEIESTLRGMSANRQCRVPHRGSLGAGSDRPNPPGFGVGCLVGQLRRL
jgi:hypothetical protein